MKTSNNTILITGGDSDIGFETAKLFALNENKVIITGRNETKLKAAAQSLPNVHYIVADVTREDDVNALVQKVQRDFPQLNVLVNNAVHAVFHKISESPSPAAIARDEMETNYLAVINLTVKLLPTLKQQPEAAIINVSSIVAFAPSLSIPTYSASKAALHSYSQALRINLASETNVKVFEIMPPLVDKALAKDIKSDQKISPVQVALDILRSINQNLYAVRVASKENRYQDFINSADIAVLALTGLRLN